MILISHGSGGSHLVYRTLAHHLARNGFIVGMPEHPFNNRNNNTLEGTVENLINRPRHIRTAIDWFFDSWKFARSLKPDVRCNNRSFYGWIHCVSSGRRCANFVSP